MRLGIIICPLRIGKICHDYYLYNLFSIPFLRAKKQNYFHHHIIYYFIMRHIKETSFLSQHIYAEHLQNINDYPHHKKFLDVVLKKIFVVQRSLNVNNIIGIYLKTLIHQISLNVKLVRIVRIFKCKNVNIESFSENNFLQYFASLFVYNQH